MGWRVVLPGYEPKDVSDQVAVLSPEPMGLQRYYEVKPNAWGLRAWHPSSDIATAYELEAEVEWRGLTDAYIRALCLVVGVSFDINARHTTMALWHIAHATPEQRCRAVLTLAEQQPAS